MFVIWVFQKIKNARLKRDNNKNNEKKSIIKKEEKEMSNDQRNSYKDQKASQNKSPNKYVIDNHAGNEEGIAGIYADIAEEK